MKKNLRTFISVGVMLTFFLFFGGYYRYVINQYIQKMNYERLSLIAESQSKELKSTADSLFDMLEILSCEIVATGSVSNADLTTSLNAFINADSSDFAFAAYAADGVNAYYNTGGKRSLTDNIGCAAAMNGVKTIDIVKSAHIDNNEYMVFYVPVNCSDNATGVLIAGCNLSVFEDVLTSSGKSNGGLSFVCSKEGNIVLRGNDASVLGSVDNFYTVLSASDIKDDSSEDVIEKMGGQITGSIEYTYSQAAFYAGFSPIGINNYLAVTIIPSELFNAHGRTVEGFGIFSIVIIALGFMLVALWLALRERAYVRADHESRVSLMISQIKPHFMYNTLSAVIALIDMDPSLAKKMVYNFSKYMRTNIDVLNFDKKVSFSNELSHTRAYVEIEKVRFPNEITVVYDIAVDDFLVPPLTIQPIVENAIKHGIHVKRGGTVIVTSTETNKGFIVVVSDDGAGFDTNGKSKKATGIDNVRRRLKKMCGGSLNIESTPGVGTKVTITVPLSNRINESERQDSWK